VARENVVNDCLALNGSDSSSDSNEKARPSHLRLVKKQDFEKTSSIPCIGNGDISGFCYDTRCPCENF